MYFVMGALIGLLGFFIAGFIQDMRHMKKLLRHQQDELSMMRRDIMGLQAEVVWKNPLKSRFSPSDVKSAKQTLGRPGEVDQELLLR